MLVPVPDLMNSPCPCSRIDGNEERWKHKKIAVVALASVSKQERVTKREH